MSLRHGIPGFTPAIDRCWDELKPVGRMKAPVETGFRSGADLTSVVELVRSSRYVSVEAAAGAGKSTRLPLAISAALGKLVVQVFPNQYLAADTHDYVAGPGVPVTFIEKPDESFPESGVVMISAACLVAKWLQGAEVYMPDCIVYHDESHESDVYTFVVKRLAPMCKAVSCFILATASPGASGFRKPETDGILEMKSVELDRITDWDIESNRDPWSCPKIDDNLLIFEDDKTKAAALMETYQQYGMHAYRFHSRMTLSAFRTAMRIARDPRESITVIIADYSFRSGFTMPVGMIVDTCIVRNIVVSDGKPLREWRAAYELERYQGARRGGRMSKQKTVYYYPEGVVARPAICDLEAVEMEAAALVFRLLGYVPPSELRECRMFSSGIPRMLHSALTSQYPLALVNADQLVPLDEFYTPKGRRSPLLKDEVIVDPMPWDVRNTEIGADVARKRRMGGLTLPEPELLQPKPTRPFGFERDEVDQHAFQQDEVFRGSGLGVMHDEVDRHVSRRDRSEVTQKRDSGYHEYSMQDCVDALESLVSHVDEVEQLKIGTYYHAVGNTTSDSTSVMFPEGYISVMRALANDKTKSIHFGYTGQQRGTAVSALVVQYNVLTCEMRVLSRVLPEAKKAAVGKDLGALRQWATDTAQRLSSVMSELQLVSSVLTRVVAGHCSLAEMNPMRREEDQGYRYAMRAIDQMPMATIGPSQEFLQQFRDTWKQGEIVGSVNSSSVVSDETLEDKSPLALDYVKMPTVGRGMRATVKYKPHKFLMWSAGGKPGASVVKSSRKTSFDVG